MWKSVEIAPNFLLDKKWNVRKNSPLITQIEELRYGLYVRTLRLTQDSLKKIDIDSYDREFLSSHISAGFITSSAFVWGMIRHDGRFVRDIMKMSPTRTAKRRRRARHLPIHFYAYTCEMHTRVHGRADAESRSCACTPTLHALSDGTDIRLRCQPIVKGTIRVARIGSARLALFLSFLSLSFFLYFFFLIPFMYEARSND